MFRLPGVDGFVGALRLNSMKSKYMSVLNAGPFTVPSPFTDSETCTSMKKYIRADWMPVPAPLGSSSLKCMT